MDFVSEPPDSLKCLICLSVARVPWQHSTCGRLFCKHCLVGRHKEKCRNCSEDSPQYFQDNKSNQEVLSLLVKCENTGSGCEWTGEMRALDEHKAACQHILTKCPRNCDIGCYSLKGYVPKKDLESHLKEECPEREYECPHCSEEGTYKERVSSHLESCLYVPTQCPNEGCDAELSSSLVAIHLATDCEFEVVECKYRVDGCNVRLMRKDLEEHEKDDRFHFQLAMKAIKELKQELKSVKAASSQPEPAVLRLEGESKEPSIILSSLQSEIKQLQATSKIMEEKFKQLKEEGARALSTIKQTTFPTITFKVVNFHCYSPGECFTSNPFYTSEQGYKLCISVYPKDDLYVKVMVHLMKGEYDSKLGWPFEGQITIVLLNQKADSNHYNKVVEYPKEGGSRVYSREKSVKGCGHEKFIHHKHLYPRVPSGQRRQRNSAQEKSYSLGNTLYFRATATASKAWLECSPVSTAPTAVASTSPTSAPALSHQIPASAILWQHMFMSHLGLLRYNDDYDTDDDDNCY